MNTTAGAIFGYLARCIAPIVHGKKTVCGLPAPETRRMGGLTYKLCGQHAKDLDETHSPVAPATDFPAVLVATVQLYAQAKARGDWMAARYYERAVHALLGPSGIRHEEDDYDRLDGEVLATDRRGAWHVADLARAAGMVRR